MLKRTKQDTCFLLGLRQRWTKLDLKYMFFFFFLGGGGGGADVDWLDLFMWPSETSWKGLHEVVPIVIAEESRMFTCVACFHCPNGIVIIALNRSYGIRTYSTCPLWEIMTTFSETVLVEMIDSHHYAHTEAKYTGIMPVLRRMVLQYFSLLIFTLCVAICRENDGENIRCFTFDKSPRYGKRFVFQV